MILVVLNSIALYILMFSLDRTNPRRSVWAAFICCLLAGIASFIAYIALNKMDLASISDWVEYVVLAVTFPLLLRAALVIPLKKAVVYLLTLAILQPLLNYGLQYTID